MPGLVIVTGFRLGYRVWGWLLLFWMWWVVVAAKAMLHYSANGDPEECGGFKVLVSSCQGL